MAGASREGRLADDLYVALQPIVDLKRREVFGYEALVRCRSAAFENALVKLRDAPNAKVVAEGIETAEEMHAVLDTGAHYGQGYLFALPTLPAPAVDWKAAPLQGRSP